MAAISIEAIRAGVESKDINMLLMVTFSMTLPELQDKAARMLEF